MKLHIIKNPSPILKRMQGSILSELLGLDFDDYQKVEAIDVVEAANEGFHIVSVGMIGLTYFSLVCKDGFGIRQDEQEMFIEPILDKKETGTLFPRARLTILPYQFRTYAGYTFESEDITGGLRFSGQERRRQICDALKAEVEYVRSGKVLFDFRDLGDEMLEYNNLLHHIVLQDFQNIQTKVFFYSANNKEFVSEHVYNKYEIYYTPSATSFWEKRCEERQQVVNVEKLEKQKRKLLKQKQNEPKLLAKKMRTEETRKHIDSIRQMKLPEQLNAILDSKQPIYYYTAILNEIVENPEIINHQNHIKSIIGKFKTDEKKLIRKLKKQLEGFLL